MLSSTDLTDKRKHPRQLLHIEQRIVYFTPSRQVAKNLVLSKNLSASGFSFSSNKFYDVGSLLLVHQDDQALEDISINRGRIIKYGRYFMARVVRGQPISDSENLFETGCAFLGLVEGTESNLDLFTRLVNHDTVERMGQKEALTLVDLADSN